MGQTPAIGGGGRYDRAACRGMKQTCREVARAIHIDGFCSSDTQTTDDAVEGGPTPALCYCETVDVRACLLRSLLGCVPRRGMYTLHSRGQRHSSCVRACAKITATVVPNCNNSSSSSVSSRRWSQVLAPQRGNPALAVAVGRMFHTAAKTQ